MIVNYEWAPLCWNHPLCVYQSELGADQERICKNLSFHTSMKTPHSACTLSLNVQIQLCRRMWNCEENLAADLERNTLWTLFHIRAFQWNFSSHAFWQSRKFTEAKVLHHEFFIRGLLKIFSCVFKPYEREVKKENKIFIEKYALKKKQIHLGELLGWFGLPQKLSWHLQHHCNTKCGQMDFIHFRYLTLFNTIHDWMHVKFLKIFIEMKIMMIYQWPCNMWNWFDGSKIEWHSTI